MTNTFTWEVHFLILFKTHRGTGSDLLVVDVSPILGSHDDISYVVQKKRYEEIFQSLPSIESG